MKASFVTWQLRRLHSELNALDEQRPPVLDPDGRLVARGTHRSIVRDRAMRRILLERLLRALPHRLGFRNARAFAQAFARANCLLSARDRKRHRLTMVQIQDLERRVQNQECPSHIALAIGCAEQTVLNRATQFRKRLAAQHEQFASGI